VTPSLRFFSCLLLGVLASTGCTVHYFDVALRPGDVERGREAIGVRAAICSSGGDTLPFEQARRTGTDSHGAPDDPGFSTYRVGPPSEPGSDRTVSPFLVSGVAFGLAGGAALAIAPVTLLPCLGPTDCVIPGWVGPLALAGLGAVLLSAVLLVIGVTAPELGTFARPYTITNLGEGRVCAEPP